MSNSNAKASTSNVINDSMPSISEKYIKMDGRTHVLNRSGMYIGSIEEDACETWIFDMTQAKMIKRNIKYVPGLFKIFDEILVNAIDHSTRLKTTKLQDDSVNLIKTIKVHIDKDAGVIEVMNDGDGIEVVEHPEHKVFIPELIFGNLLTSTNYDDNQERTIGGTNGLGAKVANIFSEWFEVETVDRQRKLLYHQRFESNMSVINKPKITKYSKKPYTIIKFKPDYERFKMSGMSQDMYDMFVKRVYDACALTHNDVTVYLNDQKIDCKNFEKYADLYLGTKTEHTRVYEQVNERWEVIASYNDFNGFEQISFVNGIWTLRGGKHVEYIVNQIVKKLGELIIKKNKNANIKPQNIKDNIIVFVKSVIINPTFDSQSKETLTSPISKFGSKCELSEKFFDKLYKTGIVEKVLEICEINNHKELKKTDGKKKSVIKGIPKLEDANWAGTDKSKECTLILTEGDSARTMVLAGLSQVGRDRYGVFPLKGKLMNVKDTSIKKITDNEEITNLKKILGLETNKTYCNIGDLRYGRIMLMCDSDEDGKHIQSLVFNLFQTLWPSLFRMDNFLTCLLTPIIKATNTKAKNNQISFYCLSDYDDWKKSHDEKGTLKEWKIKYYKGLGTSTNEEAVQYFRELKVVTYKYDKDSDFCIDLAFNKKKADDRKLWLSEYDRNDVLDYNKSQVSYEEFINKGLIHFSNYDIERSIPSIVDGLKISQRKILYGCFKRNLTDEVRVAQLASYVSEHACYHHGEASLQGAIIAMAQQYVGANNINLLKPNGQFGCLSPETKIIMWDGTTKEAQDVQVGDKLIGDDGKVRNVLRTISGIDDMYEVRLSNGDTFVVNHEHILTVKYEPTCVFDIKLADYLLLSKSEKDCMLSIKNSSCVDWDHQLTPIDPYIMGLSLANNSADDLDDGLMTYVINDKNTRLQLLAGLIDALGLILYEDGNVYIEITQRRVVIDKIKLLCNSLGYYTIIKEVGLSSSISIYGSTLDEIPIRVANKIVYQSQKHTFPYQFSFTVTYKGKGRFCGWSIDGNERFLLNDFTVTHNSRVQGGKDAGAPRYIYTMLENITNTIYIKQDSNILKYMNDDGIQIEPEYYVPIIPMILVNGAIGIGTGFSTNIPSYNPKDIVAILRQLLNHGQVENIELQPWYVGFSGNIEKNGDKYVSRGVFRKLTATKVEVTELPVGFWTEDFKELLEGMLDKDLKAYESQSSDKRVHFTLQFPNAETLNNYLVIENNGYTKLENDFKLVSSKNLGTTNMYLYNAHGQIQKYNTPLEIITEFYNIRLQVFSKRKEYICRQLKEDMDILSNKIRFIKCVIANDIEVSKMKKYELEECLSSKDFMKVRDTFEYLLRIPIYNLTVDKVEDLMKEYSKAEDLYNDVLSKSEKQMWLDELGVFEKEYEKFLTDLNNKFSNSESSKKKAK